MKIYVKTTRNGNVRLKFESRDRELIITKTEIETIYDKREFVISDCGTLLHVQTNCLVLIENSHSYSGDEGTVKYTKCFMNTYKFLVTLSKLLESKIIDKEIILDSARFRFKDDEKPELGFAQIIRHDLFKGSRAIKEALEIASKEELMHLKRILSRYLNQGFTIGNDFCRASFTMYGRYNGGIIFHSHSQTYSVHT